MMENIYKIIAVLNNENVIICTRTILAIICGGVIGLERGRSNQPAGMRTYMLVCLGSALVMLISEYMYIHFDTGDPARLGVQVINGIGFYLGGIISTIAVYMIMSKFRKLEDKFAWDNTGFKIYVEFKELAVIPAFKEAVEAFGLEMADLQINSNEDKDYCNAVIEIKKSRHKKLDDIIT